MVKIIAQSQYFTLHSTQKKRNGKPHHKIFVLAAKSLWNREIDIAAVRDMVDPLRSRGGQYATSWRFRHLREAQQLYTVLVLRWG